MYEAHDLQEFKRKLKSYEIQIQANNASPREESKEKRRHCFNCGDLHETSTCPYKKKGPKCFSCGQFGHRSTDDSCKLKKEEIHHVGFMRVVENPEDQETQEKEENTNSDDNDDECKGYYRTGLFK